MEAEKNYFYGFSLTILDENLEGTFSMTCKTDEPVEIKLESGGNFWTDLKKECVKFVERDYFDDKENYLLQCFISDFKAEYDHETLKELREEYLNSITIENEYNIVQKVFLNK